MLLAELWLLSDEMLLSCDRKLSTAADSPTAVEASEVETVLLADAEVDALALDVSEELLCLPSSPGEAARIGIAN